MASRSFTIFQSRIYLRTSSISLKKKAGEHKNRGDNAHNGAVRELLEGVKFFVGRRPVRILLPLEDRPGVKCRLAENPFDIPSSQRVVVAQMTACKTVDQPEDT
jgi:hypothetical protein